MFVIVAGALARVHAMSVLLQLWNAARRAWLQGGLGLLLVSVAASTSAASSLDEQLHSRTAFWRQQAYSCVAPSGHAFPSGEPGAGDPACEDGDMNLFAGMLCVAGEEAGCETVRLSQELAAGDDYGRWYRSPRRKENHNNADGDGRLDEDEGPGQDLDGDGRSEEREWNTFSFDMAVGTMLYLVAKHDRIAGQRWWDWISAYTPCMIQVGSICVKQGDPRLCAPPPTTGQFDFEKKLACTLRPPLFLESTAKDLKLDGFLGSDYALFAEAGTHLGLSVTDGEFRKRLDDARGTAPDKILIAAKFNDEGFAEHLVGASILLMRKMGSTDPKLATATAILNCKKPPALDRVFWDPARDCRKKTHENPFFLFLRDGPTDQVKSQVLAMCPSPDRMAEWRGDWIWQRGDDEPTWKLGTPWKRSMLWDCIFMAHLLVQQ